MSRDLDKYADNLSALDAALREAGLKGIMQHLDTSVGEFLKTVARSNVDLSAKCLRPAEQDAGA